MKFFGKTNLQVSTFHQRPVRDLAAEVFLWSCFALLVLTAMAKLNFASQDARILLYQDPLMFFLSRRAVIIMAGLLELLVAAILFKSDNRSLRFGALAWMSGVFGIYRMFLAYSHSALPCNCLGSLGDVFGLEPGTTDIVARWLFLYFAIPSWGYMFWETIGAKLLGHDVDVGNLRNA